MRIALFGAIDVAQSSTIARVWNGIPHSSSCVMKTCSFAPTGTSRGGETSLAAGRPADAKLPGFHLHVVPGLRPRVQRERTDEDVRLHLLHHLHGPAGHAADGEDRHEE